jgi:uncharacterized protein (TIGR02217 family)
MVSFHEVSFPLRLALGASGGPMRRTDIVNLSNGRENRNQRWRNARRRYEVGSAIKTLDDLYSVLEFFEARRGQLYGFRFGDPLDYKSGRPNATVSALDVTLGIATGTDGHFQLVKDYGDQQSPFQRVISKPRAQSVLLAVDGTLVPKEHFTLNSATGAVTFDPDHLPEAGAVVTAGFEFDVPVRFDVEQIEINLTHFQAGQLPHVALVEILP